MADKIDIQIDAKVLFQMYEYAAYAKHTFGTEIAGWGHYNRKDGIYKLAPLLKQIVSGAEVDTFPDDIIKDQSYDISDMTVQWHSHVDMGVTPSWTDKKLIKEALELYPYLLSIIVNCKNQYFAELNMKRSGELTFQDPVHLEVELVAYYNNPETKKIVEKQCRLPAPIVVVKPTMPSHKWSLNFEKMKEELQPLRYATLDFYDNDLDFFPPNSELINDALPDFLLDYDIKQIKNKAILLDKRYGKDIQMICAGNVWAIQHLKTGTYCEIGDEVMVQGVMSDWNEFIRRAGITDSDLFYSPGDCVACGTTGMSSKKKVCKACNGAGKIKKITA